MLNALGHYGGNSTITNTEESEKGGKTQSGAEMMGIVCSHVAYTRGVSGMRDLWPVEARTLALQKAEDGVQKLHLILVLLHHRKERVVVLGKVSHDFNFEIAMCWSSLLFCSSSPSQTQPSRTLLNLLSSGQLGHGGGVSWVAKEGENVKEFVFENVK
jgi:hypothetical protein